MVGLVVVAGLVAHRGVSRPQVVRLLGLVLGCAVAGLVTPLGLRSVESITAVQAVSPYIQ
jgi:hypothetical protein